MARGFVQAAVSQNGKNETFNITNDNSRTLLELAECAVLLSDLKIESANR